MEDSKMQTKQITQEDLIFAKDLIGTIENEYSKNIIGQKELLNRMLIALMTNGHMLLEGVPGIGKTRSIRVLSKIVHGDFRRIQFTPDLLPSDIIGNQVFNPKNAKFEVKLGPIFGNFILADEINRAPAKVQSALLESMQEKQITIGDQTYVLPDPFIVLATQNPIEQEGTYPLPEAQIDRFLLKFIVKYPNHDQEIEIMNLIGMQPVENIEKKVSLEDLKKLRDIASNVKIDEKLVKYIADIIQTTREPETRGLNELSDVIAYGASPRGSLAFLAASKALALISGRDYVIPEDIKDLKNDVLRHRIVLTYEAEAEGTTTEEVIEKIFNSVVVP